MPNAAVDHAIELCDGALRLRPWQPQDADALLDAVRSSLDSVGRWLPWCHAGYGKAEAEAWITHCRESWESGQQFAFGVFDAASGEVLGGVGLNQLDRQHRSANLGYWIRQSHQGEGRAARAAALVARFGFGPLGLIRIEVVALPENRASRRTAEKLGARFEAVARQRLWAWGEARDAAVYGLVPGDLA